MVYSVRMQCGRVLAREAWINADIVSSVPESGTAAAHGFSREVRGTCCYWKLTLVDTQMMIYTFCHTAGINLASQIWYQFLCRAKWRKCTEVEHRILRNELHVKLNCLWNCVILNASSMSKSKCLITGELILLSAQLHVHQSGSFMFANRWNTSPSSQSFVMFNSFLPQDVSMLQYIKSKELTMFWWWSRKSSHDRSV